MKYIIFIAFTAVLIIGSNLHYGNPVEANYFNGKTTVIYKQSADSTTAVVLICSDTGAYTIKYKPVHSFAADWWHPQDHPKTDMVYAAIHDTTAFVLNAAIKPSEDKYVVITVMHNQCSESHTFSAANKLPDKIHNYVHIPILMFVLMYTAGFITKKLKLEEKYGVEEKLEILLLDCWHRYLQVYWYRHPKYSLLIAAVIPCAISITIAILYNSIYWAVAGIGLYAIVIVYVTFKESLSDALEELDGT